MVIALSAESACVAVDVVELKIVVFRPLDGATFVSLYTLILGTWGSFICRSLYVVGRM